MPISRLVQGVVAEQALSIDDGRGEVLRLFQEPGQPLGGVDGRLAQPLSNRNDPVVVAVWQQVAV